MNESNCDLLIRMKSQATYAAAVRSALEVIASQIGLDNKACGHVILAFTEAVANIIKHGYCNQPDNPIWVGVQIVEKKGRPGIRLILEDECPQIDLKKIKSRPLDEVRPGGLGVHIISQIMEDVTYEHRECGKGLRLTMHKYANPQPSSQPPKT